MPWNGCGGETAGVVQRFAHGDRLFAEDIFRLKKEGRKAILLGVGKRLRDRKEMENLRLFREMGVVYMTLCHNGANDICDSARATRNGTG
jgi:microsomal dipeptidase-like Zn-dependent dipeptidase